MGLASYGRPKYIETFRDMCRIEDEGAFTLNLDYFEFHRNAAYLGNEKQWVSKKFMALFGEPRVPESEVSERDAEIAASLQLRLNEVAMHLTQYLYRKSQCANLCIAGGVGLNSVMNGHIFLNGPFEEIFIPPAANDAGNAVGAALHTYHFSLGHEREIWDNPYIFIGPEYSDQQIKAELDKRLSSYVRCEPAVTAAKLLADGKILGWFQDRMEFGPRALGNRSILADPRDPKMKDHLNRRVKHREGFRPFAPSVLQEKLGDFFASNYPSDVMLLVYDVLEEKRSEVPAITHVDGTGRVQSVSSDDNPGFYRLITEFYKLTGIPMVLNTSFNVRGEPMVCTPADALNCFYATGIDNLVIGNYLVSK
ncbi:MAG: carbamoyltransferase C-terminal domain-containing protein [Betaproteobacteria bacterium]